MVIVGNRRTEKIKKIGMDGREISLLASPREGERKGELVKLRRGRVGTNRSEAVSP